MISIITVFMMQIDIVLKVIFLFMIQIVKKNNEQAIGFIRATFLDEELIADEDAGSLAEIADLIDGDITGAFEQLEQDKAYSQSLSFLPLHSCYISTFFIEPEYRGHGLGTHLLKNLDRIYRHMFNIYINYIVVYPNPYPQEGEWKNEEEKIKATKRMSRFFEKNKFFPLGNSGFYATNYLNETL